MLIFVLAVVKLSDLVNYWLNLYFLPVVLKVPLPHARIKKHSSSVNWILIGSGVASVKGVPSSCNNSIKNWPASKLF